MKAKQFGQYILLHQLGKGGMAEVYLAKAKNHISKVVAVKTILESYSTNKEFAKMFATEAKTVMNMSHKNIAFVIDYGCLKKKKNNKSWKKWFLVLEYVKGKNLRHVLRDLKEKKDDFTFEEKLYLIKEVALGLDYAHRFVHPETKSFHIVHSDVSPQNIMVSTEGEVKVIDFGIAKSRPEKPSEGSNIQAKTLQGKYSYMSPEQAGGLEIDQRTDIFSLGIILWELLAKERLFYANTPIKILKKVKEAYIPDLKKVNPETPHITHISNIVKKALIRDRNLRYATAKDFHDDLSKLLNINYPSFNPSYLGQKIQKLYKEEFASLNEIIEAFQDQQIDYEEKTKTITIIQENDDKKRVAIEKFKNMDTNSIAKQIRIDKARLKKTSFHTTKSKARVNQNFISQKYSQKSARLNRYSYIDFSSVLWGGLISCCVIILGLLFYFKVERPEQFNKLWFKTHQMYVKAKDITLSDQNKKNIASKNIVPIRLFISSHPKGAKIFVDGVWSSLRTPKQITFQPDKVITLKMQGYADYTLSKEDLKKALLEKNQFFVILKNHQVPSN